MREIVSKILVVRPVVQYKLCDCRLSLRRLVLALLLGDREKRKDMDIGSQRHKLRSSECVLSKRTRKTVKKMEQENKEEQ